MWRVLAQVKSLDLSRFEAAHRGDGVGHPAYEPKRVLALLFYCANKRMTSGPEIEQACRDDLGARLIMGGKVMHRSTVDRFRDRHHEAIRGLLPQTLARGDRVGLLDPHLVAGDGTKMTANAAMGATVDEATLLQQIADLQARIEQASALWADKLSASVADREATAVMFEVFEVECPPADTPEPPADVVNSAEREQGSWRKLQDLNRMLTARQAALQQLRTRPSTADTKWDTKVERDAIRVHTCQERLDATRARLHAAADRRANRLAAGEKIGGTPPVPVEEHLRVRQARAALATATARAHASAGKDRPTTTKINTTDPDSRIMPGKQNSGFDQRYNVQALACTSQLIIAIGLHNSSNDKQALIGLLLAARANLDAAGIPDPLGKALFDAGYASEDNFNTDLPVQQLLVAVEKEARQTQRLRDDTSTAAAGWTQMSVTMAEPDNIALYKRRAAIIEPVFAQLFARTGRDLPRRGTETVLTDLHLRAVVHNLNKIDKATTRTPPPQPG